MEAPFCLQSGRAHGLRGAGAGRARSQLGHLRCPAGEPHLACSGSQEQTGTFSEILPASWHHVGGSKSTAAGVGTLQKSIGHTPSQVVSICQLACPGGVGISVPTPRHRGSPDKVQTFTLPSMGHDHLDLPSPERPPPKGLPAEAPHRYTTAGSNMLATSTPYSSRCGLSMVSAEGTRGGQGLRRQAPGSSSHPPLRDRTKTRSCAREGCFEIRPQENAE